MDNLLLFLYLFSFFLVSSYVIINFKKKGLCLDNFFLFWIILYYLFIPINIIIFGSIFYDFNSTKNLYPPLNYVSLASLCATLLFILSYIIGKKIKLKGRESNSLLGIYTLTIGRTSICKISCYILSFVSLISLVIYINEVGGLFSAIINAQTIRSGYIDTITNSQYLFVKRFIEFAFIPFTIYVWQKRENLIDDIVLFFIPLFILVFLVLFLATSKTSVLVLFIIPYLSICLKTGKYYLAPSLMLGLICLSLLDFLDNLFVIISMVTAEQKNYGFLTIVFSTVSAIFSGDIVKEASPQLASASNNKYLQILSYFVHYQVSLNLSLHEIYDLRFFQDIIIALRKVVPDSFIGLDATDMGVDITQVTTALYNNGNLKNLNNAASHIPPGIIPIGIYSFSLPGLIILGFAWGYMTELIDFFFKQIININNKFSGWYAYAIIILGFYCQTGLPRVIVGNTSYLIFFLLFFVSFKLRYLR